MDIWVVFFDLCAVQVFVNCGRVDLWWNCESFYFCCLLAVFDDEVSQFLWIIVCVCCAVCWYVVLRYMLPVREVPHLVDCLLKMSWACFMVCDGYDDVVCSSDFGFW